MLFGGSSSWAHRNKNNNNNHTPLHTHETAFKMETQHNARSASASGSSHDSDTVELTDEQRATTSIKRLPGALPNIAGNHKDSVVAAADDDDDDDDQVEDEEEDDDDDLEEDEDEGKGEEAMLPEDMSTSMPTEAHPTLSVKRLPVSENERSSQGEHSFPTDNSAQTSRKKRVAHKPMTAAQQEAEIARLEKELQQRNESQRDVAMARIRAVLQGMDREQQVSVVERMTAEFGQKHGNVTAESDPAPLQSKPHKKKKKSKTITSKEGALPDAVQAEPPDDTPTEDKKRAAKLEKKKNKIPISQDVQQISKYDPSNSSFVMLITHLQWITLMHVENPSKTSWMKLPQSRHRS